MKRREFLKKASLAAAGTLVSPYILPSGRMFARTATQKADHVVLVMFAGGVRQQESALQGYLALGQPQYFNNLSTEGGNIMTNIFNGAAPNGNFVPIKYGNGVYGDNPIPQILPTTIQSQGVVFKETRSIYGGHYGGWVSLLDGNNKLEQGLRVRPVNPTIFEYVRRHTGAPASKVWFVGTGVGNSLPLLNYSDHPDYGAKYGANFFAPLVTFGIPGQTWFENGKAYDQTTELDPMYKMKDFLDKNFSNVGKSLPDILNTSDEKVQIQAFMKDMFTKTLGNSVAKPPGSSNGDAVTIGYTAELLKKFTPTLTVVNLGAVDICHSIYTNYLQALHAADHSVGFLWNYIQTQIPEMAGNTVMIIAPECGRDLNSNPVKDINNYYGYDHSDSNSLRSFSAMVGKSVPSGLSFGDENNPMGLNTNVVPTIADILGVKQQVMDANLLYPGTQSFYDLGNF